MFSKWCQFSTAVLTTGLISSVQLFAADSRLVSQSLDEVNSAQSQTDILLRSRLAPQDYERVRYVSDRLRAISDLLNQSLDHEDNPPPYPGPGPGPYPPPQPLLDVELFRSDSCSSSFVGTANETTDCNSKFRTAPTVWGVRINHNQCIDISDMSATQACESVKGLSDPHHVKLYQSDSCSGNFLAAVTTYTDCSTLPNKNVWAISQNGICQDISDISMIDACERFRPSFSISGDINFNAQKLGLQLQKASQ
jgi:hypothetical protein